MPTENAPDLTALLHAASMPDGTAPEFDPDTAPDRPFGLFAKWLDAAIAGGVAVPHAAQLATSDAGGTPSVRTLLLVDGSVQEEWLAFASTADSPKGADLEQRPRAALVLHWREQHRQVRLVGGTAPAPREVSEADFRRRSPAFKATTIAERQSVPLPPEPDRRVAGARELLAGDPAFVPPAWTVWRLHPDTVEFWQGPPGEPQRRLRYRAEGDRWRRERLWP